jgi:hypothetical protein
MAEIGAGIDTANATSDRGTSPTQSHSRAQLGSRGLVEPRHGVADDMHDHDEPDLTPGMLRLVVFNLDTHPEYS